MANVEAQIAAVAVTASGTRRGRSPSTSTRITSILKHAHGRSSVASAPEPTAPPVAATPCDANAGDLAKKLANANGEDMELGTPEAQKVIDEAKATITGKSFAFTNCRFVRQGNDTVTFKASPTATDEITCVMAGGDDGNRKFRDAAMSLDMDKLQLDVRGIVQESGEEPFRRLKLTDCEITPHE